MTAESRMIRARTQLLVNQPWFGTLAMRLKVSADESVDTMWTNGTELGYNPAFVNQQTDAHLQTIVGHKVMHCALLHPFRRGSRELGQWNEACDFAINGILKAAGFEMPADARIDAKYDGLSADVIYAQLGKERKQQQEQQQPQPQPNGQQQQPGNSGAPGPGKPGKSGPLSTGSFGDAPSEAELEEGRTAGEEKTGMSASDWQVAAEQATMTTKAAGTTPGGASRAAKNAQKDVEDWRTILREFIEQTQPTDYSWQVINRRHIAAGLYLPGMVKENLGRLGIGVDTSGSISQAVLSCVGAELTAIMHEARPEAVDVVYCDHDVQHVEEFTPDDPEIKLSARGGGGTRFQPILEHFSKAEQSPAALLIFTDLYGSDNSLLVEPDYPTLWITDKASVMDPPFGRVIRVDLND